MWVAARIFGVYLLGYSEGLVNNLKFTSLVVCRSAKSSYEKEGVK